MQFHNLGVTDYTQTFEAMKSFTHQRHKSTADQIWFTEHHPVFTQGLNGKHEHIINPHDIPVINTDRGGQVTYHGPGQLIVYFMINLIHQNIGVKQFVHKLENIIVRFLHNNNIDAYTDESAPGVYINGAKIAALGVKIRKGCSYHGMSLNNCMDLKPFSWINPCGFENLVVTQLQDLARIHFGFRNMVFEVSTLMGMPETLAFPVCLLPAITDLFVIMKF